MFTRAALLALPVALTVSVAWTPAFLSVFPVMFPVAALLVGWRPRIGLLPGTFLALAALAAVSAIVTGAGLGYGLLWATLAGLYVVARHRLPALVSTRTVATTAAAIVCGLAVLAVVQVALMTTAGSPYSILAADTMKRGLTAAWGTVIQRPVGVFHNSNMLGQWLIFAGLLLLPTARALPIPWRIVTGLLAAVTLALTYSRAIWGTVAAVGLVLLASWVTRARIRAAVGAAVGTLALIGLAITAAVAGLLPDRFSPAGILEHVAVRQGLNTEGLAVAADHPIFGVGYLQYPTEGTATGIRPHNVFVQVAAEQGIPAAVALVVVAAVVALTCWRAALRTRDDLLLRTALIALPVCWVGFLLFYSSAADYAVMPIMVTALGYLLATAERTAAADAPADELVAA